MNARILIVEDESVIAADLRARLARLGYAVPAVASCGEEALQEADQVRPDVVLMDIVLKGEMDGVQTAALIQSRFDIPVIYMTACPDPDTVQRARLTRPYGWYILKPGTDNELYTTIEVAIDKHGIEKRLRASEARFRSLIENTRDIVAVLDAQGIMHYLSPSVARVLQHRPEDMLGQRLADWVAPEDTLLLMEAIQKNRALPGMTMPLPDFRMRHSDGSWRTMDAQVVNLLDDPAVKGMVVNCHDITGREQTEEHVKRLSENLERRASELAALNKASQAIVSTLNFESVLKLVIGEVRSLLDTEGASLLLRDPASDELVFAAVAGVHSEELAGARMPITKGIAGWVMQNRQPALLEDAQSDPRFYPGIDGKTGLTTRSVIAVPLRFKGAVWGVVEAINKASGSFSEGDVELLETLARSAAIAIENAQLYQAELELRRLVEQSRAQLAHSERLAATGRLTATLAHEINNPLQAIFNCLQMMRNFQLEPDEQQEYLQIAMEEVERLTGAVNRVLDFSRQPQQVMKPVQLNQIVEKVSALTGRYLQHRHIALQQDLAPDLPPTLATPDELVQVFLNLVLNAADAMTEGGMLRVTSRLADDGRLTVAFSDTGSGIPAEHLPRIFEPFFSTKENGTGIGLDISNRVVRQHGGEITVASQVGKGTTFTVWLPIVTGPA